jgi:hypothetical protein
MTTLLEGPAFVLLIAGQFLAVVAARATISGPPTMRQESGRQTDVTRGAISSWLRSQRDERHSYNASGPRRDKLLGIVR